MTLIHFSFLFLHYLIFCTHEVTPPLSLSHTHTHTLSLNFFYCYSPFFLLHYPMLPFLHYLSLVFFFFFLFLTSFPVSFAHTESLSLSFSLSFSKFFIVTLLFLLHYLFLPFLYLSLVFFVFISFFFFITPLHSPSLLHIQGLFLTLSFSHSLSLSLIFFYRYSPFSPLLSFPSLSSLSFTCHFSSFLSFFNVIPRLFCTYRVSLILSLSLSLSLSHSFSLSKFTLSLLSFFLLYYPMLPFLHYLSLVFFFISFFF